MWLSYKILQIMNFEFEKSSKIWENVSMNTACVDNGSRWRRWLLVVGGGALLNFKNSASSGYSIFLHSGGGATRLLTQPSQPEPDTKVRKYVSVLKWKLGLRWRPNHCVEIYNFSAWTPRCYVFWLVGFSQSGSFPIEEMNGSSGQPEHQRCWNLCVLRKKYCNERIWQRCAHNKLLQHLRGYLISIPGRMLNGSPRKKHSSSESPRPPRASSSPPSSPSSFPGGSTGVKRNPLWRDSFQHLQEEETDFILSKIGNCIFSDCSNNHNQVWSWRTTPIFQDLLKM